MKILHYTIDINVLLKYENKVAKDMCDDFCELLQEVRSKMVHCIPLLIEQSV